jgi:T-complex protein 1 subunit zeta
MASILCLNPKAELARADAAREVNISAARGLQDVMRTNLGPKGTLKMLVSGSGDIKLTKDGNVLLKEMSIQHPTASMIARASTAQDDHTGDGTTSTVLLIGELLKQADVYLSEGLHPRLLVEGFELAKEACLEVLDEIKVPGANDRAKLLEVAQTSLRTKLRADLADHLTECLVDAIECIRVEGEPLNLHMVEIQEMQHKSDLETTLVKGLVLDHGARHPDMPKRLENAYILTCNVSLEYEKTEVNSGFFYKTSEEREKMVGAERAFIDARCRSIVDFKKSVCGGGSGNGAAKRGFVLITQKGIDPPCLDILARAGIVGLRRAKRRNMERLTLACGGNALNSFDGISKEDLGTAGVVYEHVLGEDKFTFVEDCANPHSCTLLIKGPNKHTITQIKDAINDGLRAIKNAIDDDCVVPGAGAFEVACGARLQELQASTKGRARLGVKAFADALAVIPKTLAGNGGYDAQEIMVRLDEEHRAFGTPVGLDLNSGEPFLPQENGIWDNHVVKKQLINSCTMIASNLLLVDEIMKAGMSSMKG